MFAMNDLAMRIFLFEGLNRNADVTELTTAVTAYEAIRSKVMDDPSF